jgi:hypothetical protein
MKRAVMEKTNEAPRYITSRATYEFLRFRFKYNSQYPLLRHSQSMFLPCKRQSFTAIQTDEQNYSFVHSNLNISYLLIFLLLSLRT